MAIAFLPSNMCHPASTPARDNEALTEGIHYIWGQNYLFIHTAELFGLVLGMLIEGSRGGPRGGSGGGSS